MAENFYSDNKVDYLEPEDTAGWMGMQKTYPE
jgi:hypothetical protein